MALDEQPSKRRQQMNISRSEARIKYAIFVWLLAAVAGVFVAVFMYWLGLWALIALCGGIGTVFVLGTWWSVSFLKTDEELAATAANMRQVAAARAPYKEANEKRVIVPAQKPGTDAKAAPTVAKSAPTAAAPAPAAPKPAPAAAAPAPAAAAGPRRPAALSEPRGGVADDLQELKGVGPKLEKQINALGIFHYDQIAAWGPDEVAWMDDNLEGFKGRVSRDGWVSQAKALAGQD